MDRRELLWCAAAAAAAGPASAGARTDADLLLITEAGVEPPPPGAAPAARRLQLGRGELLDPLALAELGPLGVIAAVSAANRILLTEAVRATGGWLVEEREGLLAARLGRQV